MLIKKTLISVVVALAIIAPIMAFADILAGIPHVGSALTRSYWTQPLEDGEAFNRYTYIILFAGPVCFLFFLFWHLWIQRYKAEEVLVVVAKAFKIHRWLKRWVDIPKEELPAELTRVAAKARKVFKRLDRLVSLSERDNWRPLYSGYLTVFYFSNASELPAFRDFRVDPPVEEWPKPDEAPRLDAMDRGLLENAVEFSEHFTNGAKASTGLRFMMHTVYGSAMLVILSVVLGGILVLGLLRNLGGRIGLVLAPFTCAVVLGLVVGYAWHRISLFARKTPSPDEPEAKAA
jgi:hypothetical protein